MNTYFSIGEYCATAHQIRRFTSNTESFFFDWLVTRGTAFQSIRLPSQSLLRSKEWEVVDNGLRLLDRNSGLLFQHEFKTIPGTSGIIDESTVELSLSDSRKKYIYLQEKMLNALKTTNRGVLIRAENGVRTKTQVDLLLEEMRDVFLLINKRLRFVIASVNLDIDEQYSPEFVLIKLQASKEPNNPNSWQGDDQSWDRLFNIAETYLSFDTSV